MNSFSLKEKGFPNFLPLKELQLSSLPENTNSVIVIADITLIDKPESDILYIGKTKKLAKKIFGGYFAGYGNKTTQKIHTALFDEGYIEKTAISWFLTNNPKATQKELLENFKKEHTSCPPWNAIKKLENKPQAAAKKATPPVAKALKKVTKKQKPPNKQTVKKDKQKTKDTAQTNH
ncbi:MAG: hypothetical protein LBQ98_07970 [Nitrososphaerota archaeon]|jgi:hypothetical protein|nr:hypothetical protein [Nitrososphaerota archaeon]